MTQDKMREALAWNCSEWPQWLHAIVDKTNEVADRLDMSSEQSIAFAVLEALSAERQSAERGEVAVKPLRWEKPLIRSTLSRAETLVGIYRVWTHHEANGQWFWSLDGYEKASGETSSEIAALTAAQADYETRIRSALIAAPAERRVTEANKVHEAFGGVLAALAASISLLERTPKAKKAAPSDTMFNMMLNDYKGALEAARPVFAALSHPVEADALGRVIELLDSYEARFAPPHTIAQRERGILDACANIRMAIAGTHDPADAGEVRPCACHPDDNPPRPCPQKYALTECREAALSRSQGAGSADAGWRPIDDDTPRDGTRVDLWHDNGREGYPVYGSYRDYSPGHWSWRSDDGYQLRPTHWRPASAATNPEGKGDRA